MATPYTVENGRLALPHLVECAKRRTIVTYKELGERIGRHQRTVPHLLAYLRDEVCAPRDLPLITALVVSQETRLPGYSCLPHGPDRLDPVQYLEAVARHQEQVFGFGEWDAVLRSLDLRPL